MAKPSQSSFRRILLSRILLLSVPVILIGEAVTYRKARSSLLETARRNLTQSAVIKGEIIRDEVAALKANLLVTSQTSVLQEGTEKSTQLFLDQLKAQLPAKVQCVQITNQKTGSIVASTCGNQNVSSATPKNWWPPQKRPGDKSNFIYVEAVLPGSIADVLHKGSARLPHVQGQLQLLFSAPVYDRAGKLRYALSIQSALDHQKRDQQGLLAGSTVVIDQNGTILAHPTSARVGGNIEQEADAERLKTIVKNAIGGRQPDFVHLSSFEKNGVELLGGFTAIPSPMTNEAERKWTVLAVTPMDNALYGLHEIKIILFALTVSLLAASLLATLYLWYDLARPLEKLRDYALSVQSHGGMVSRAPHDFKIRELNQLAKALDHMVERLKAWADEIETSWEEAQAANQLKNEFMATTSHELRTPLNAIIGCVRLVRDGCCDDREEEIEFLQRADEAAIHLLGIINDLLDISRIEAGKLSVVLEPLDLKQVLKEVINLQTVQIEQKGLQLNTYVGQEPIPVQADPAKLKQVLINVIGNAVKFTEQGSITISTRVELAAEDKACGGTSRVVVTVEDTGVGIDPAQQHKLFRPFVMVDGTTTRKFGGTGLGLAISRNLIEMMGGSIMLCSAGHDQGTTVAIAMPLSEISPSVLPSCESVTSLRSNS